MNTFQIPERTWHGARIREFGMLPNWRVSICHMAGHDREALFADEIAAAVRGPIGCQPLCELAGPDSQVAIVFDDITRITRCADIIPYILDELTLAGVPDANIRFIGATGCHRAMDREDFVKKLGEEVLYFPVYSHNPFSACVSVGTTSQGIEIWVNAELMSCDVKIAIGSVVPHKAVGFSGGLKTILPGVCSLETVRAFHRYESCIRPTTTGIVLHRISGSSYPARKVCQEAGNLVGLNFKIDVISSLLKVKENKRVKESTLTTYEKRLRMFQQRFSFLPENPEAITDYLSRFDGESGRHRLNHQDLLNMLYTHATRRFGLSKNPVTELERPIVTRKPVKTLSLEQTRALDQTPENLRERTALDLLEGHGWRQIEVRRVQARDVTAIDHQLIMCRGKEREEPAPVLPETADHLRELARGLKPDDFLFVGKQTGQGYRTPLGEDDMSQLIARLLTRARIKGFTGHDLRRTFATLVTAASYDEFLAMRLMRDRVPGLSDRYIRYPMDQLVETLETYSPIRQSGAYSMKGNTPEANIQKVTTDIKLSRLRRRRRPSKSMWLRLLRNLVETGESRTPPETQIPCFI